MSLSVSDTPDKNDSLNIPEILADFFLKKFDMPSYSDDSDHKHKSKRKKSKHKKRKHKKSRHRRENDSSDSLSESPVLNSKAVVDDLSSSEEMGIQRLKKIKSMKLQPVNKIITQTVFLNDGHEIKSKSDVSNSSSKSLEFYGPSLDLLLSGTECSSSKNDINVNASSRDVKDLNVSDNLSQNENESKSNTNKSLEFYGPSHDLLFSGAEPSCSSKDDVNTNVFVTDSKEMNISNNLNQKENEFKDNGMELYSMKQNDSSSDIPVDSNRVLQKDIHNVPSYDKNNTVEVQENVDNESDVLEKTCEIQKESVSEKNDLKLDCDTNEELASDFKQSDCPLLVKHKSVEKEKKRSRSHSRSKSHSRNRSPKSKHRRTSRSSSRDSYHSRRKRKKNSHSHTRERSKSYEYKRRSRSRSISRSRNVKRKKYSRSRSRSPYERRHHRRSRSRSRGDRRARRRSRSRKRRSYSRDRDRSLSKTRYKSKSKRRASYSRSRSKSKHRRSSHSKEKSRSRSGSKEKKSSSTKIDQAKILETARKNVLKMMQNGTLPEGLPVENLKKEQLITIQSGGKSVQELTDFCQRLSQKENEPDDNEDKEDKPDDETGFIHHPFKVKEPGMIKLNIKNAVQLPIKTHAQKVAETARLSSQFPVSSGNQHKQKELEWIPVVPATSKTETKPAKTVVSTITATSIDSNKTVEVLPENPVLSVPAPVSSIPMPVSYPCSSSVTSVVETSVVTPPLPPVPLPPVLEPPMYQPVYHMPVQPVMPPYMMPNQEMINSNTLTAPPVQPPTYSVFKPPKKLDIPAIVAKRFQALTKLQQDPNDPQALKTIQDAQESIQEWVQSQQVPGLFTGSTDAKMLTAAELCGPKYHKIRKDIFSHAPPVTGGKGMSLLKKMGWNPGEGLGKNNEGSLEPLMLDIKLDKKGLVSEGENSKKGTNSFIKELEGKHPVSALMELCSKRRWKPPLYTCVLDQGPAHRKLFCFKVEVNGVEYQPLNPCSNKKIAKADAAVLCLQSLNILSKDV